MYINNDKKKTHIPIFPVLLIIFKVKENEIELHLDCKCYFSSFRTVIGFLIKRKID